jgi:hypothetical protein
MADVDCGEMKCESGHFISFHKDIHRFTCSGDECNSPLTSDYCPECGHETLSSDDKGYFCNGPFCYCSDDLDLCLESRIMAFQIGLEACDPAPVTNWELDFEFVEEMWDAALERGIVTQREHKWGLEEATEYFSERNQREYGGSREQREGA